MSQHKNLDVPRSPSKNSVPVLFLPMCNITLFKIALCDTLKTRNLPGLKTWTYFSANLHVLGECFL